MRTRITLAMGLLAALGTVGNLGCSKSSWCADCDKVTPIQAVGYPSSVTTNSGDSISINIQSPVGGKPTSFEITGGTLPPGVTLNPLTGQISGTSTTPGVYVVTVTGSNASNRVSQVITITIESTQPLGLAYVTPQAFPVNVDIPAQLPTVTEATPGLASSYAITAGSLPAGLALGDQDGAITGTPTTSGTSSFEVTVRNGSRTKAATVTYTISASSALSLAYTTPLSFTGGVAIPAQTPAIANTMPGVPVSFAITSGSLPAGLTLGANGAITGTPSTPGVYTFVVTATNGPRTATASVTYTVEDPAALTLAYGTPRFFPQGTAVAPQAPTTTHETPGVTSTYALLSGSLPTGLALNTDGTISGTPTVQGVSTFTIRVTNGTRTATASATYTVENAAALGLAYATPQTFAPNVAIATQTPTVSNPTTGLATTFALTAGSLPTGLVLNADGTLTGTPTVAGTYPFTVTATSGTRTASAAVSYTVQSPIPTGLNYTTPVTYLEQSAITPNLPNPSGGAPTSYTVTAGTLPAGLVLDPATGVISGTPTGPTLGAVSVTIRGSNAAGNVSQTLSITVNPAAPTALNYSTPNTYFNGTAITTNAPNPTGGTPSSYAIMSGILPLGLSIDPTTGLITGTPTAATAGPVSLVIRGTNVTGWVEQTVVVTVNDVAPGALHYSTPNTYLNGTPIQVNNPNPTGGIPNAYTITAGALPAGLTLDPATGVISGKPTANGTFTPTIEGSNGLGAVSQAISITVTATAPTALHYATPVTYVQGTAIAPNYPNPVGGTPTSYSVIAGSLPAGLSLDATTGVISGTPTATTAGPVSVTIRGTNASGNVSQVVSINVPAPIIASFAANPVILPVGQKAELSALFSGGTGTVDNGIGAIQSGASLYTPAIATPQTLTYTLTVTNGVQTVTQTTSVQWVAAGSILTVPINLSGGGGVDVTDPMDPFYGFKVAIPSQDAVCQDTNMTVIRDASTPGAIPAPAQRASDTFTLSTDIGYPLRKPATVTLPYDPTGLVAGDVPVPFFWDPVYSKWVANGLKSLDTVNHRVTFTTLLPGSYLVMVIPNLASTLGTQATGFVSNVDGWFQPNQGVFDLPGGSSFGMSAFASWYFSQEKAANAGAGLYSLFRQGPIASDDVAAKALISRLANGTLDSWSQVVDQAGYQLNDQQTGLALVTALQVTGQPQIFLMGEARPVVDNALATAVWSYDSTAKKFHLMDPNYPGTDLTITWDPTKTTGGWTAYDRAAGYFPTFSQYAFEGHTSIHRLVDYERAFQGANSTWPTPPFAHIDLTTVGNLTSPTYTGSPLQVQGHSNITIAGTVTNGDEAATHVFWSENGGPRTAVPITAGTFTFTLPSLADPYVDRIMLETTSNPCDPTFAHSGFLEFKVKDQALQPWFSNSCFEAGYKTDGVTPTGWITEQGSNSGKSYPGSPTFNAQGVMNSYTVTWTAPSGDSALVGVGNDPIATSTPLPRVLDGTASLRLNNSANGAHISRAYQTLTVPTSITKPQLSFYWAAVLESAGHGLPDQPYADILIQDVTDPNAVTTVYFKHFAAQDPAYPGWQITGGWGAIPWQKVSLPNLTSLKGHKLKITVTAADCTAGGHGGYLYLDNVTCD